MRSRNYRSEIVGGERRDTVKLFDISVEPQDPCVLTYSPSPGLRVNSVKWNHNNLVLASAGEDSRISLWRKNGQSLWTVPAKSSRGEIIENKRCVKWLKGHTDTITGVMYNCKDEHIASVSRKGDLILHNLASGTKAAELRDPNGQVLGALDYSRMSRHLLVTAGDDGSIHLWDTTGRNPKMEMSSVMSLILENQADIMKELHSLRNETQELRRLLVSTSGNRATGGDFGPAQEVPSSDELVTLIQPHDFATKFGPPLPKTPQNQREPGSDTTCHRVLTITNFQRLSPHTHIYISI
ncbi:protein NEDD1 [Sesamum angolense]|uniref:Protein NEDD1 n=1 Tax=Sesamum angolense TaxID=2727404 RepID=A0AAE1T822_9LAMI|nr:protein NEDD1 [Sesamum angolense]